MEKTIFSEKQTQLVQCINQRKHIYQVLWDEQPVATDDDEREGENEQQYSYQQALFSFPPTAEHIKATVLNGINAKTDARILTEFKWDGKPVWLSNENQFNFKAAYDLALQTQGETLPMTFKLGETQNGEPVYHEFKDVEELTQFYASAIAHIHKCLTEGWAEKDCIDWSKYQY